MEVLRGSTCESCRAHDVRCERVVTRWRRGSCAESRRWKNLYNKKLFLQARRRTHHLNQNTRSHPAHPTIHRPGEAKGRVVAHDGRALEEAVSGPLRERGAAPPPKKHSKIQKHSWKRWSWAAFACQVAPFPRWPATQASVIFRLRLRLLLRLLERLLLLVAAHADI